MRVWYTMKAENKKAEITIYDFIGKDFWSGEGVDAKGFYDDLKALGEVDEITLRINSPGGVVTDGVAIYNLLDQHPARVTAYVDGIAASAASLILMAADEIKMPENAFLLIHEPRGMAWGTAEDAVAMAEDLNRMTDVFASTYAKRSGSDIEAVKALMKEDRLMTAAEAAELGYIDNVIEQRRIAASFDASHLPPDMRAKIEAVMELKKDDKSESDDEEDDEEEDDKSKMQAAPPAPVLPAPQNDSSAAIEIAELCSIAGYANMTAKFMREGKSVSEVRAELVELRAKDDEKTALRNARAQTPPPAAAKAWSYIMKNIGVAG